MNYYCKETEFGPLTAYEQDGFVTGIKWERRIGGTLSPMLKDLFNQLYEYFRKERQTFNLPLKVQGTEFQKRVWNELSKIPYGECRTY